MSDISNEKVKVDIKVTRATQNSYSNIIQADGTQNNFNFLYEKEFGNKVIGNSLKIISGTSDENSTNKSTVLSPSNLFYYTPNIGHSSAMCCDKHNLNELPSFKTSIVRQKLDPNYTKDPKLALVNCVGWACGRVIEVWKRAVDLGYITKNESGNFIRQDGLEIIGNIFIRGTAKGVYGNVDLPAKCPADYTKDIWEGPASSPNLGWEFHNNINEYYPRAGDLLCVKNSTNSGHILFIEQVINPGTEDEYYTCTEGDFCNTSYAARFNTEYSRKKLKTQKSGPGTFLHILSSPVSQLLTSYNITSKNPMTGDSTKWTYGNINPIGITEAVFNANLKILQENSSIRPKPNVGDSVKIVSLGFKDKNSDKKTVNYIKTTGRITEINLEAKFAYGVSIGASDIPTAYYSRRGFNIINKDN